jgi:quercetin dioxygenase-like cupin family protein
MNHVQRLPHVLIRIALLQVLGLSVLAQDVTKVDAQHYHVILENAHMRVIDGRDKPGDTTPMHHHPAYLSYIDGPVKTRITLENENTVIDGPSDRVWCSPPTTHSTENTGTNNTHKVLIEFKDFDPCDDNKPSVVSGAGTECGNATQSEETESAIMATVLKNERGAFDSIKTRDKKKYADLMADEMIVISAQDGRFGKQAALESFDSESFSGLFPE